MLKKLLLSAILLALPLGGTAFADPLSIRNETAHAIINILVQAPTKEFFLRLDLLPQARDSVENPDCTANLRADTGLAFWSFQNVNLRPAKGLTFCATHPVCLLVTAMDGSEKHINGQETALVPQPGDHLLCSLSDLHPGIRLNEICAILPQDSARDDNGAVLTGLGFADLPWAARFVPAGPVEENPGLDHLELRRALQPADVEKVITDLYHRGYEPWQAEFPGHELDFAAPSENSEQIVLAAVRRFLESQSGASHRNHSAGEKCSEASILMAPSRLLPSLENSDEPTHDVQIFTLLLHPCTNSLIVDVAAYQGSNG